MKSGPNVQPEINTVSNPKQTVVRELSLSVKKVIANRRTIFFI